jgi:hypothetical protein
VLLTTGLAALAIGTISGRASAITGAGLLVAAGALAFGLVLIRVLGHLRSLAHTAPAPQARAS